MAYEGEVFWERGKIFQFAKAYIVIVSGCDIVPGRWHNRWGHMLLNTGGPGGDYFQVVGFYDRPRIMNESQFQRYLKESKKYVVTVYRINIPQPDKSQSKLEEILLHNRLWLGYWHNCETMVEEVVIAGGGPRLAKGWTSLPVNSTNQCAPW